MRCWAVIALALLGAQACAPHTSPVGPVPGPPPGPRSTEPESASAPVESSGGEKYDEEPIDDGLEGATTAERGAKPVPHPLADLSDRQLEKMIRDDPTSVGSMSLGRASGGALMNGVQMPTGARWNLVDPAHAWGTQETVDGLIRCINKVHKQFPNTPEMHIGHISAKRGGHLNPHKSHQSGRDVDVSYYHVDSARWYKRGTAANLDLPRTWAFVRALITETDIDLILIDHSIQKLLKDYALSIGEDETWLNQVFRGEAGRLRPLIRHARGHATHIHVRFFSPVARETARRAHPILLKVGNVKPPTYYVNYRAKKGDTLGSLANRYGTTVKAIMRANGLRSTLIRAKRVYKIPKRGGVAPTTKPIQVPPRRLPPLRKTGEPGTRNRGPGIG